VLLDAVICAFTLLLLLEPPMNLCRYMEEFIEHARHVEVQCFGDGSGRVITIGERECSLQRKQQKMIEIAPAPSLSPRMRDQLQGEFYSSF
jgi:acetyl/propionyl-CoA carboxylase alpha subunit